MRRRSNLWSYGFAAGVTSFSLAAHATTEPPVSLDARVLSMGSTAVAHAHNGAAVYHNAAALHEAKTFVVTGTVAPTRVSQSAPVNGPNTSVDSDASIVPLFLAAGAYRVSDRLVLGLGAFTTGGIGAEYESQAPGPYRLLLGAIEFSPVAAFSLTKNLAIGVGYRVTYMFQELGVRVPMPDGSIVDVTSEVSGISPFGVHAGIYYRPTEALKLGFAYRSKTTASLDGTQSAGGMDADTSFDFSFPHGFRLGAAYEILPGKLLVAVDGRYLLHSEANDAIVTETAGVESTQELGWENSWLVGLGLEFFPTPAVALRAGYSFWEPATPEDRPAPFFIPPGLQHTLHAGAGLRLESVDVDLGGYYGFGSHDYEGPFQPPAGSVPGEYTVNALSIALGVSYRR